MRTWVWQPALLAGITLLFCCQHRDAAPTATAPRPPASERVEARVEAPAKTPVATVSEPVSLRFAWPERFAARVEEEVVYERRVMQTERRRHARWSYALRSAPSQEGFTLFATGLTRVRGEPLPMSVIEMNALQPALVITSDGDLRSIRRLRERRALWSTLTRDGIDREISSELRDAALREDQFVALDAMRWNTLVSLWNRVTLRPNEVVLVDGWFAPDASGAVEEAYVPSGGRVEEPAEEADVVPRASLQLVNHRPCPNDDGRECVELRLVNVVEDNRTMPASVFRVDVTLLTEPDGLTPHRLIERTSQMSRFESVGAETSTVVERHLDFHYDVDPREGEEEPAPSAF